VLDYYKSIRFDLDPRSARTRPQDSPESLVLLTCWASQSPHSGPSAMLRRNQALPRR